MKKKTIYYLFFFVLFGITFLSCQKEDITTLVNDDTSQILLEHPDEIYMLPNYNVAVKKVFTYNAFPLIILANECEGGKKNLTLINPDSEHPHFFTVNGYIIKWVDVSTRMVVHHGQYFEGACGHFVAHVYEGKSLMASAVIRIKDCGNPEINSNM